MYVCQPTLLLAAYILHIQTYIHMYICVSAHFAFGSLVPSIGGLVERKKRGELAREDRVDRIEDEGQRGGERERGEKESGCMYTHNIHI